MEYRTLGRSGLKVPVLSFGTGTFGGQGAFFERWGSSDVAEASKLIDICLDVGVNFFDTANIYSRGASEEVLGGALKGRRDKALISTKASFTMGDGPNDKGSSRWHLLREVEASLKRLGTDYIDVYFMHGFDALTPLEEILLIGRDYEHELMPLALDQGVGTMVWSPLGWGRLTGKITRHNPPKEGRIAQGGEVGGPPVDNEHLYDVVDVLVDIAGETGKTASQVALNWLLSRPSVCNIVVGARNAEQLQQNLGAVGWLLTKDQIDRLDAVSRKTPPYPYWHQIDFEERNPKPTKW